MLGIALIIILGFVLFHYRPRKLEMETGYPQSFLWAKIGSACFISHVIWMLAIYHFSLVSMFNALHEPPLQGFIAYITRNPFYPFSLMSTFPFENSLLFMFTSLFPIVSVGLTLAKLVRPLSQKKAPSQNWFHFIGLFSATCMGACLCYSLYTSGVERVLQALPVVLFYFSILLIGIFAVETSGHRLSSVPS